MYKIFAKIRTRQRNNKIRKIVSTQSVIYGEMEIENSVPYDNMTLLDDNEWFFISNFSSHKYANDIIKYGIEDVSINALTKDLFTDVDFIVVKNGEDLYFQNVSKARIIRQKGIFVGIGNDFCYSDDMRVIQINPVPDAFYKKDEDKLYFKKLPSINGIFRGISDLYREATSQEVRNFLEQEFLTRAENFSEDSVPTPLRKRIAAASDVLNGLADEEKRLLFSYTKEYCPTIATDHNTFMIRSAADLKLVLDGIEQRFYTTGIGDEKRIANSIIRL